MSLFQATTDTLLYVPIQAVCIEEHSRLLTALAEHVDFCRFLSPIVDLSGTNDIHNVCFCSFASCVVDYH